MTTPVQPLIRAIGLSKSFAGVRVVSDVSFDVMAGEVHTLLGENGAGKSTVLKMLAGVHQPDEGSIEVGGATAHLTSVHAAQKLGIALIHQEPLSFPDLTVAENIYLGSGAPANRLNLINRKKIREDAISTMISLGVKLDPSTKMAGLSIADQQMVELAAALSRGQTRILLMDEPTAALTPAEVRDLFRITRQLRDAGTAIVFISHRLEEVMDISDRITILRDGAFVATKRKGDTSPADIISLMVGRPLGEVYNKESAPIGEPLLRVENLSSPGRFENISLEVRRGEIVGMAGLVGAGRTEVAETIFGLRPKSSGQIFLHNSPVTISSPRDAIAKGIAYVPEDRQKHGLLMPFPISTNTTLASPSKVSKLGFIIRAAERAAAEKFRSLLRTRCRDVSQPVRELSGGNQQKVVLSKWLMTQPEVLILDEPTRGIDVGAKAEVHHVIGQMARDGKAILMISSDLPEVLGVSDRVLVMKEGRLTGHFPRADATQERVMTAATTAASLPQATSNKQLATTNRLLHFRELGIAIFLALAFITATLINHSFASASNLRAILLYIPLIVVVAMGQMMVIVSRNIDLSVGSALGLSSMVVGSIFIHHPDFPLPLAALLAIAVGSVLGLVNGVLVAYLRVPAIIATLGTLSAYRGLTFMYSAGKQIDPNDIPDRLIALSTHPASVPWIVILAAFIAFLTYLFLKHTRFGREVFAIGSNPHAAALRGINVRRDLALIFIITGGLSGLGGFMWPSRFPTINPGSVGSGFELVVISAVIIGGTSVFGGAGSVLGTLLGCILLGTIYIALPALGISGFYQLAIYGAAILIAALIDHTTHTRQKVSHR